MKKIVIIGAGVSGLSCGIYGQKNGFETIIYEKTPFAGGNLTGWFRQGCYIDNCVHWLNGSKNGSDLNQIWKDVGAITDKTTFYQSDYFFESELKGQTIGLHKDTEKTRKEMLEVSPLDKKEIDKFINCVNKCKAFFEKSCLKNKFNKLYSFFHILCCYKNQTLHDMSLKFKHPLLRRLFTDYILEEYSVYSLIYAYSSFASGDGMVFKDGSQNMAKRIESQYKKLGGKIVYNSQVNKVVLENERALGITLENGILIPSNYVVCACDPTITFLKLLNKKYMPKNLEQTYKQRKSYPIVSSFHIAYKIENNKKLNIPETLVFETEPIKVGATKYNRIMIKSYKYGKKFSPSGTFVLQVFLLQRERDYNFWEKLQNGRYAIEKSRIVNEITKAIIKRFPQLKEHISFLDCWTPLTYNKYFDSYKGSYMSFGITKKYRMHLSSKIKPLHNVYLATQWQTLFGGLPNAVKSGKKCIDEILQTENKLH